MLTLGLIIAFTLVGVSALVVVAVATGLWAGIKASRPELMERGDAVTSAPEPPEGTPPL